MRTRRIAQTVVGTFVWAACVALFLAVYAALGHAQGLTVPQQPERPVSPSTPGTVPGTAAGPKTAVGTNPITGAPCVGSGSSAINGGITGTPTAPGKPPEAGQTTTGLPPNSSVFSLNNQLNNSLSPGAC